MFLNSLNLTLNEPIKTFENINYVLTFVCMTKSYMIFFLIIYSAAK